jgi:hypothetical protein
MRMIFVCFLFTSISTGSDWTVLCEITDRNDCSLCLNEAESGWQVVLVLEESLAETILANYPDADLTSGIEGSSTDPYPEKFESQESYTISETASVYFSEYCVSESILKLSESGDTLWTAVLDSVYAYENFGTCIMPSDDGGCFAVLTPPSGSDEWTLFRLDESGEEIYRTEFHLRGGPAMGLHYMEETPDSGVLLTGYTDDVGMNLFMFLIGFDDDGEKTIETLYDLRFHASGEIILLDEAGNIYIAGYTASERSDGYFLPPMDMDVFVMKVDPEGNEIWQSSFEYPLQNSPRFMALTQTGDVLLLIDSYPEDTGISTGYTLLLLSVADM